MARQAHIHIDFDEWRQLAQEDPEAFEKRRQAMIEIAIRTAPAERQHRLRGLQWRIDQERRRAPNPMAGCLKLSRMMWDTVQGEHGLLAAMESLNACWSGHRQRSQRPDAVAQVIPIRHSR